MKAKVNINLVYDIVEAKITEINGFRPDTTETGLGLDSLDLLDVALAVENQLDIKGVSDHCHQLETDMTPLELTLILWESAESELTERLKFEKKHKKFKR